MLDQRSNATLQPGVAEQEPDVENASSKWQRLHSWSITAIDNDSSHTEKPSNPNKLGSL
jgi:hypothetical protein